MSSQARNSREDERRIDVRTLVIASIASAVAAIVVSRIWTAGTPIAAAATPVLITLFKEALDRPTTKIAERLTVDSPAVADTTLRDVPREEPSRVREVASPEQTKPGDVRIYRQQPTATKRALGKISPRVVLITGLLAFVIAGVVITAGQIAIGNPFGSDGKGAIILGQHKKKSSSKQDELNQQGTITETAPSQDAPQQTTPKPRPGRDPQTTTTTPQQTTPRQQTAPQQVPTTTTPAP